MYIRTNEGLEDITTTTYVSPAIRDNRYYAPFLGVGQPLVAAKERVKYFTCTPKEQAKIEKYLKMSILPGALKKAVETAAGNAVSYLWNASSALQTSPRKQRTKDLFCQAFGTSPETVPSWRSTTAKWIDRGDLVATRLNSAAKILDGGFIRYFCWGSPKYCPECTRQPTTYFACSSWGKRYVICFGQYFWKVWQERDEATMASTLLHEALHIYFGSLIAHGESGGRYGNANCYERFVVLHNNLDLHRDTNTYCSKFATPCP
jgi:hypothetical protein